MEVIDHEHPLVLVDLELKYSDNIIDENDESEDDNSVIGEEFQRCPCNRCDEEINEYHRFYYKCINSDSCGYSIHKFCGDLPQKLNHISHNVHDHTLVLKIDEDNGLWFRWGREWSCQICGIIRNRQNKCYSCSSCSFEVCISCVIPPNESIIYHPSHIHPLVQLSQQILCKCRACGKKHHGTFYHCTKCTHIFIHIECALFPKKLVIQNTTNNQFSHTHSLTLSYLFSEKEQEEKFYPICRVCGIPYFGRYENTSLWIYKCDKCWYYVHVDCATSRGEAFMSILSSPGLGKTHKDYEDVDHPDLVHLPFHDQDYSILKHKFFKDTSNYHGRTLITHMSHQHQLILVDTQYYNDIRSNQTSSSKLKTLVPHCHDPMKKIELLCDACVRPIMSMPFYKCANEDELCNFVLHEWCTRLPEQVHNHPGHSIHTLKLLPKSPHGVLGLFTCDICDNECNGFVYSCAQCKYYIDVTCAFIPLKFTHEAHPNHIIWRDRSRYDKICNACSHYLSSNKFSFGCRTCDFYLHVSCALLLPGTIRHKYDKHPMNLSYFPAENHKSEYFCEVCEEKLDPCNKWYYHCNQCDQSIHSACAPLVLENKRAIFRYWGGVHRFVNIKFGSIHHFKLHQHPLSFAQGIDSRCHLCRYSLEHDMIFKCLHCKYAVHIQCCMKHKDQ